MQESVIPRAAAVSLAADTHLEAEEGNEPAVVKIPLLPFDSDMKVGSGLAKLMSRWFKEAVGKS